MNILSRIRSGWTALKFLQVGLGSLILYTSIENRELPGIVFGALFTLIAISGNGMCCMAGSCATGISNKQEEQDISNTSYEELGDKQ